MVFQGQSDTGDNLSFLQDLLFYMIDTGTTSYRVPTNGVPIDFLNPPIRTTRFQKLRKALDAFTEDTGEADHWRLRLFDDQSGEEYGFDFVRDSTDPEFLFVTLRPPAPADDPLP